jgi:hypothetical protein
MLMRLAELLVVYVCAGPALARENTTGELALLVAEYGLLLEQLDVLADSIASQMAPLEGSNSSHGIPQPMAATAAAGAGKSPGLSIVNDDLLTELAAEIPDLRYRVGVSDAEVFGANPLSPTRLKLQVRENGLKVLEGVNFLTRGVRLLGSDVGNAGATRQWHYSIVCTMGYICLDGLAAVGRVSTCGLIFMVLGVLKPAALGSAQPG